MTLKDNKNITDEAFIKLGAKGVIKPNDTSLQVVLGAKAEVIADGIKAYIKNLDENNPIS
jgi:PTS system N-acetylglucosamine-specific IIC component